MEQSEKPIFEDGVWKGIVKPPMKDWQRFRSTLLERLNKYPFRVSQIDALTGHKELYGDMADRITSCAVWLKKQNVQPGDIIGICSYNNLNTVVPLIASLLVGALPNSWWDATLTDDMIKYFLNLTKPKIIFSDERKYKRIKEVVDETGEYINIVCLNDAPGFECLSHIIETQDSDELEKFKCEDLQDLREPALILYTSGTSGYPKGCVVPYGWLMSELLPISETPDIILGPAGISWVTGLMTALITVESCATLVIHPRPNEEVIMEIVQKYKVKRIVCFNTAYVIRLWKTKNLKCYDFSSLEYIMIGGSAMPPGVDEFAQRFFKNAMIVHGYGCTELYALTTRFGWTDKPASCGHVARNVHLKIIDVDTGKTLGPNQEGELCAKYPYRMLGYLNNPEATKAVYDDEGWYHSGDLAYYDDDGEFFIVDRLKELIKFRIVFHIAPGVIEKVILSNPGVLEAAVVARPHWEDVEQPMAFITLHSDAKVTENDIIDLIAKNLPDHMQLRGGVVILDKFPYTNSGKVAKVELKRMMKSLVGSEK
ncbi:4-coumarate--CoA ligase 1 [Diachasma alloeum]|uniref:4-coumarate--CoA ligase 1 n=1 Tax=Diachasma alloeum TaxID=454923 RepID=UPI0007381E19|nr:4-coumarate--CoA ligase 1 [Diachasma alloeum]XP_015114380.1 4-coumarate--CoA ligase 1 [Diachasma alloeum]